jgi:Domain of unknown function (DUF4406)
MPEPLLIFVAGPYTNPSAPERERNVSVVHGVIKQLMRKGHIVLECHSLEHAFSGDDELMHADFLRQTLSWLSKCDAIYFVSSSPGADLELAKAEALGIRVFHSLDEVPTFCGFEDIVEEVRLRLRTEAGRRTSDEQ